MDTATVLSTRPQARHARVGSMQCVHGAGLADSDSGPDRARDWWPGRLLIAMVLAVPAHTHVTAIDAWQLSDACLMPAMHSVPMSLGDCQSIKNQWPSRDHTALDRRTLTVSRPSVWSSPWWLKWKTGGTSHCRSFFYLSFSNWLLLFITVIYSIHSS